MKPEITERLRTSSKDSHTSARYLSLAGNENKSMISSSRRVADGNGDERLEEKRLHPCDALSRA